MRRDFPTIRPYVPTPRGDAEWFARTVGGPGPTLHHANRQSSIRNHQSQAVYEYDVYGQVAASDPNHPNRFLFTGREFDAETGLYYYRARYYNPAIGRFLQTDPIGYADSMNWYMYCGNNPAGFTDPSGLARLVFYDGREDCFREGADDDYFDFAFDISAPPPGMSSTEYVIWLINNSSKWADEAEYRSIRSYTGGEGEEITDVYFMGHGYTNTIEFGESTFAYNTPPLSDFFADLGDALDNNAGTDAVIHLRQCQTARKTRGRSTVLEAAARASGHSITGCEAGIGYFPMDVERIGGLKIPIPEALRGPLEYNYGGPDYECEGAIIQVTPYPNGRMKYETTWYPGMTVTETWLPGTTQEITMHVPVPQPY